MVLEKLSPTDSPEEVHVTEEHITEEVHVTEGEEHFPPHHLRDLLKMITSEFKEWLPYSAGAASPARFAEGDHGLRRCHAWTVPSDGLSAARRVAASSVLRSSVQASR